MTLLLTTLLFASYAGISALFAWGGMSLLGWLLETPSLLAWWPVVALCLFASTVATHFLPRCWMAGGCE